MNKTMNAVMSAILVVLLLASLPSCGDGTKDVEFDASRLENAVWEKRGIDLGKTLFHFNGGLMTETAIGFGTVLWENQYAYRMEQDTVYLRDLMSGQDDKWKVWVLGDDDAQIVAHAGTDKSVSFLIRRYK